METSAINREEALERVRSILVEQLGVDDEQVTEDASFQGDLDADSLDLVELIMELEDQFGLKISDEDAQKIATVGEAVDYVTISQLTVPTLRAAQGADRRAPGGLRLLAFTHSSWVRRRDSPTNGWSSWATACSGS